MKKYLNEKRKIKIFYPILSFPWHIAFSDHTLACTMYVCHIKWHFVEEEHFQHRNALSLRKQRLRNAFAKGIRSDDVTCDTNIVCKWTLRRISYFSLDTVTLFEKNVIVHFTCFYACQNLAILTLHYSRYTLIGTYAGRKRWKIVNIMANIFIRLLFKFSEMSVVMHAFSIMQTRSTFNCNVLNNVVNCENLPGAHFQTNFNAFKARTECALINGA